ncbi:MAG: leucine-rich repeat protein, partial [Clostridia bacterium]|nr:leucine-rich repeat protein [Clostridia bacterium]
MKIKKNFIAILTVLAMSVQMFCPVFAENTDRAVCVETEEKASCEADAKGTYENLEYEITGDEVTITGYEIPPEGELVIPETIEGFPVTAIGDRAFEYCTTIISVSMPSVETVGAYAFAQEEGWGKESSVTKLKSVNMPKVQSIGEYAFEDCVSLTTVEMPQATSVGVGTFYSCDSVTSVEMPSVRTIGDSAFESCKSLTSVGMENAQTIGERAFVNCQVLECVEMPNVQTIGDMAFIGCRSLTSFIISSENEKYSAEGGILYNKDKSVLVTYPSAANDVTISDSVQTIGDWALAHCTSLMSIEMPNVQTIGDCAIAICTSLESVEMPNVQTIGKEAFSSCVSLTSVEIPNVQTIDDYAFFYCESLKSAYFYSDAPTSFGEDVFEGCAYDFTIYYASGTQGWTTPTWNGYPAYPFDANGVSVTGVTLDKTEATLEIGETVQLIATVIPEDATNKNVTWKSSDESIATVDENGLVTAISAGTVTITVTTENKGFTANCEVTVFDSTVSVTGVTLDKTEATLEIGETVQLIATVTPEDATNKNVTWKSSDESIATVDENGLVTAISAGTVTITVTTEDGGFTANCEVTVNPDKILGDLNGDGKINTADAVAILKAAAEITQL